MSVKQVALAAVITTGICVAVDVGIQSGWITNDGMYHTLSRAAVDISVYATTYTASMVVTNATTGDPSPWHQSG
jgi:hypothetical protein